MTRPNDDRLGGRGPAADLDPAPPNPNRARPALALLAAAVVPATWGHLRLLENHAIGWLGSAIAVIMVAAAARFGGDRLSVEPPFPHGPPLESRQWPVAAGVVFGAVAWAVQLTGVLGEGWVATIWLLALACLLAPNPSPEGSSASETDPKAVSVRRRIPEVAVMLLLLGVALAFRLPHLERYPASVHNDEASCGLMAQQVLERRSEGRDYWFVPLRDFWYFPSMGFFPSAATQAVVGPGLFGHRLSNVVLSMASLVALFLLARSLAGFTAAATALGLAAVGHTAVHWSRSGIHSGHAAWLAVLCALLLWKAVSSGRRRYYVLLGFAAAACVLTYNAALLLPVWLVLVVAAGWTASPQFRHATAGGFAIALLSAVVFAAPMLAVYQNRPSTFFRRSSMMVWTNDPSAVHHMRAGWGEDFRRAQILENWRRTTRLLHTEGDANLQYGNRGIGMVDGITGVAVILGLGVALGRLRRPAHWPLLLLIALDILLGAILVMDGVQYSRIAGLALLLMALPALWAGELTAAARTAYGPWAQRLVTALLAAALIAAGAANRRYTFSCHDALAWSGGGLRFGCVTATLARNIRDWGEDNITFVHSSLRVNPDHRSFQLTAGNRAVTVFEGVAGLDLATAEGFTTATFAVAPSDDQTIRLLEVRFPGGTTPTIEIERHDPSDVARLYRIDIPQP